MAALSSRWMLFRFRNGAGRASVADAARDDDPAAVDAAIARVLAAEAKARDDIAAAMRGAEACIDDARRRARRVAELAEARVREARRAHEDGVTREVARLEAEAAAQEVAHALTPADRERVARAVARVAADLTGPS